MRKLVQNIVSLTEQVDFHMPKKKKERNIKTRKAKNESWHRPHIFHKNLLKINTDLNV